MKNRINIVELNNQDIAVVSGGMQTTGYETPKELKVKKLWGCCKWYGWVSVLTFCTGSALGIVVTSGVAVAYNLGYLPFLEDLKNKIIGVDGDL